MSPVEQRLKALEEEVARLRAKVDAANPTSDPWIEDVWGAFANDPDFLEAMRFGREYRESQRPKARKKRQARKR